VWVASGHVVNFDDPLMDCRACKARFRADHIIETHYAARGEVFQAAGMPNEELERIIRDLQIPCPTCGRRDFTGIRQFNMMFKTHQGVTEDSGTEIYLRPETAQGMFVNFKNVMRVTRKKLPVGICQMGKSFRNEITPGNFIFRTREFEQMEMEFFVKPGEDLEWFDYWRAFCRDFLISLGLKPERMRMRDHTKEELSFYSKATTDIEYLFPFGWGELWGIADRTDYDLKQHQEHSGESMEYVDPETGEKFIPYCVEPAVGVDRMVLSFLCDAYDEEALDGGDSRTVLRLHPALAPYKAAVMPLQKNKLGDKAKEVYALISKKYMADYDETGSIGKRYRRQDEIGTPMCVTIDFGTLETGKVTVRDRDSMEQDLVDINDLDKYIEGKIAF
jgi:glycyl-tRNA synthetase